MCRSLHLVFVYQYDQCECRIIKDTSRPVSLHASRAEADRVASLRNQAAAAMDSPCIYRARPAGG